MGEKPSLIIFGPQSKRPKTEALKKLWLFLHEDSAAQPLKDTIISLPEFWPTLLESDSSISELKPGLQNLQCLSEWITKGSPELISDITCGAVVFPLLLIFHVANFMQYLRRTGMTHADLLNAVADAGGGIQGFCVGFLTAVTVSGSIDERDLIDRVCDAIKLSMAIGVYSDLGAHTSGKQQMVVVRLKNADQAKIISTFSPAVRRRGDFVSSRIIHWQISGSHWCLFRRYDSHCNGSRARDIRIRYPCLRSWNILSIFAHGFQDSRSRKWRPCAQAPTLVSPTSRIGTRRLRY